MNGMFVIPPWFAESTASVEVDSFALYESRRTPEGPEYQVVSSYPLVR